MDDARRRELRASLTATNCVVVFDLVVDELVAEHKEVVERILASNVRLRRLIAEQRATIVEQTKKVANMSRTKMIKPKSSHLRFVEPETKTPQKSMSRKAIATMTKDPILQKYGEDLRKLKATVVLDEVKLKAAMADEIVARRFELAKEPSAELEGQLNWWVEMVETPSNEWNRLQRFIVTSSIEERRRNLAYGSIQQGTAKAHRCETQWQLAAV